jgi:hypothetical protein
MAYVRHFMRTAPSLLLACTSLFVAVPALADPPPPKPHLELQFEYTRGPGTESCPSEHTAHDLLIGGFLYDPVKPDARARLQIAVTRKGGGFHAEISIYNEAGELAWVEEMDDRWRCMPLIRSAVVSAAIFAEEVLRKDSPAPPPAPPATPPPPPVAPPIPPPVRVSAPPKPAAPPAPKWMLRIGAGPVVSGWLDPGVSMGVLGFGTGYWADFFSFTVEGRVTGSILPASGDGFALRGLFFGGAAVPCLHRRVFFVCGALHLGWLQGSADRGKNVETQQPFRIGPGLRPGFEWTFAPRLALRGFAEATGMFTRSSMVAVKYGEVWKMSPVGLSVGLALAMPL